jgi:hypothetical protein
VKAGSVAAALVVADEIGYPVSVTPDPPGLPRMVVTKREQMRHAVVMVLPASTTVMVNVEAHGR